MQLKYYLISEVQKSYFGVNTGLPRQYIQKMIVVELKFNIDLHD